MACNVHSLSSDECSHYDREIEEILKETLAAFANSDSSQLNPSEWKFLARRDQISVYRAVPATGQRFGSYKRRVVASGFLTTRIHDILNVLDVADDEDFLTTQAILNPNGYTVLDAAVLTITEPRQSHASPFRFTGVKWYLWRKNDSSVHLSNKDSQRRDLLTYERMGVIPSDTNGELIYHVMVSVNKPDWPLNREQDSHIKRADSTFCFLYRKVCEDLVECFALVDYNRWSETSSKRTSNAEMANRVLAISRFPACARAKILSKYVRKAKGRPVLISKICVRCGWRRNLLESLRICCICKNSVCHKCCESKMIFSLNTRTHVPETNIFCNKCIARIKISTAKKSALLNQLKTARGESSTCKDKDSERASSEDNIKSWKNTTESETGRHRSSFAVTANEGHTPNYETLFQKCAISDKPWESIRVHRTMEERDGNLRRIEAERAYHSFLERRERLAYLDDEDQTQLSRREPPSIQETLILSEVSDNLQLDKPVRNVKVFGNSLPDNQAADLSKRTSDARCSRLTRDNNEKKESGDIFRRDLYGQFW